MTVIERKCEFEFIDHGDRVLVMEVSYSEVKR